MTKKLKDNRKIKGIPENNRKIEIWIVLAIIFFVTLKIYYQSTRFGFLLTWDDNLYLTENPDVLRFNWSSIKLFFHNFYANNYHPLTMVFYALEYKLGHGSAFIFHFNNVVIHILNTYLVFLLLKKIYPEKPLIAIITAAFFAVHPMHVESVAWVAERKDVLYTFFFLLSLIFYCNFLKSTKIKHLVFTGIFFVLSCLSKSAAVILPLVLLLLDYYYNRKFNRKTLIEKLPFFAISALFGLIAINSQENSVQGMAPNMSTLEHILIVSYSFFSYILKAFFPIKLSAFYPYPQELGNLLPLKYYLSVIVNVLIIGFVWYSKRFGKDVIFGFLFFIVTIILVLQLLPVGGAVMADRYSYVPYIGLFLIVGILLDYFLNNASFKKYQKYILSALVISLIVFSIMSYNRVKLWENDGVFFSDIIDNYPFVNVAYKNRGSYYLEHCPYENNYQRTQNIKKAVKDFESSIQYSKSPRDKAIAYNNMGVAKLSLNDSKGAIEFYSKAITADSTWNKAYVDRGTCLISYANNTTDRESYIRKAISDFKKYLKYSTREAERSIAYYDLGYCLSLLNNIEGAIKNYSEAIKLNSKYFDAYNNRGSARHLLKDYKGAISDFDKVIELNPQNAPAYFNRGLNKYEIGDYIGAIGDFNMAVGIDGNLAIAYALRGRTKMKLKQYENALEDFNIAVKLNPRDVNSIQNRDIIKSALAK